MNRSALPLVRRVWPSAAMLNMQASTGGAEAARDVPGAIVGEHAPDADAVVAKSAERPPEKAGDGGAVIIGSELDV